LGHFARNCLREIRAESWADCRNTKAIQNGLLRNYLLFSCYRDGQELEAELGCLFAKTSFSSLPCLFVATVEDGFCVGFPCPSILWNYVLLSNECLSV